MRRINLRIAELRKNKKMTQQDVADAVGVSFQTVSKWENGSSMPDITMLPLLADYFQVTVDQILGLVPLEGEKYISQNSGTSEFWSKKLEYLLRTRKSYWNVDYINFLVKQVWKIDKPVKVLDCGCGYGFLGLLLMPLLPEGSTYTGIDFAENLLEQGKQLFAKENIPAKFVCKNVYEYQVKDRYDIVISQAVLRHLDEPERFVQKMMDLGKDGAYIICIDANREFECDGLYVDGMDYAELCKHDGLVQNWKSELAMQGRDYAIAIRAAHIMRKLGLLDIGVRMNDKVEFVTPQMPDYEQTKQDFLTYNDWEAGKSKEELEKTIAYLMSHGVSRREAEEYCNRNVKIEEFFKENPEAGYTFVKGQMISYGRKKSIVD